MAIRDRHSAATVSAIEPPKSLALDANVNLGFAIQSTAAPAYVELHRVSIG
tara:strand:- start:715 stop:867 length:153 start_codon:yes stop_codon:yes gene_type:complete